ncbi:chemotaxis protein CheW [Spectribacter hydrogenoxidans]|uniref:Chemotaxis protein CheW n=1 Tax=Spectribacter hydrogenoxidans TaxID=3075608 RepID=A0ABU3BVP3_9GAMM|nr:chemotaxis protein CheW [Salinisphaera sp. W335]MDT0633359.1 chemotaxis protein CheW [Salinisphaera sp. W335]
MSATLEADTRADSSLAVTTAVPVRDRWIQFAMGDEQYLIAVLEVQEVMRMLAVTPVPGTPPAVIGVINVRGHIVPVVDLAPLLGLARQPDTEATRLVVFDLDDTAVALRVDRVAGVRLLDRNGIQPPPAAGMGPGKVPVSGVCDIDGHILMVLDREALAAEFRHRPGAAEV